MNYYFEIKNRLIESENYAKIKRYSIERHNVLTYFEIGRLLFEAGKSYGENILGKYSNKLQIEVGKKYTERTLRRYRQFYLKFNNSKWSPIATELSWSHYVELLPISDESKLNYYIFQCIDMKLSRNDLRKKIKNQEYERLDDSTKLKLVNECDIGIQDFIKNPIVVRTNKIVEKITEKDLQNIILENIVSFLKELGSEFCFIENEYKIKVDDRYNFIDLLLYNYKFNCFVVVELKITELKKEYIGQVQFYMNYIDKNLKTNFQDNTIGIIICKKYNSFVMEYCSDSRIFSREFLLKKIEIKK